MPEVLTAEQVAEWLKVDVTTVTRWAAKGQIPGKKVGTLWRFSRPVLERWLESGLDSTREEAS